MDHSEQVSVLLVDDRPDKLLSMEAILGDLPLRLVCATSGGEALRCLLREQFALILLDIDMPSMDGFETAHLIRQRRSSRDTPIIFLTAHHDDVFMARGYSLGAVDYILQPVVPEILRSKVSVFVDLSRKNRIVLQQAQWQKHRAMQLQKLAAAAISINAASSVEKMLRVITDSAREVIESHMAFTVIAADSIASRGPQAEVCASYSARYAQWRERRVALDKAAALGLAEQRSSLRIAAHDLDGHPEWSIITALDSPPMRGLVAAPLRGQHNQQIGFIYVSDKVTDDFTADDEAILVQLAQMAAVAIDNLLNFEAREANRAKDQFIATLSHELRTPLTPALATLLTLEHDGRLSADIREQIQLVHRNVKLEARLIDDLLDLTRISKGKVELHLAPVDAHELLHRAVAICDPDIAGKELQVSIDLRAHEHFINGDATRLQQVLWNLIKNAIKFTASGGCIRISSTNNAGGAWQVEIADTGIGIDPDVLPRIFAAFEQGKSSITRQFGGLGLGLAISKAIVDRHLGTITAQSPGPMCGATFTLVLPVTHERPPVITERAPAVANREFRAQRILLVEDHADTAQTMMRLLTGISFTVDWAPCIADALRLAAVTHYDVLISDIGLPDGSGLDLVRQLNAREFIPAIALSGFGMEDDIRRSLEAGFSAHLTKPLEFDALVAQIHEVISLHNSHAVTAA